jgi:hypothetical protein
MKKNSRKYTDKIDVPHYQITGSKPKISELINEEKAHELLEDIILSKVSWEERRFLIKATYRHLAFDYKKIAEYYANADQEMQKLMEKSALVIIDYDDAIKNGYALYSKRIQEMRENNA